MAALVSVDLTSGLRLECHTWASKQCLHPRFWKAGHSKGRQRWQCALCGEMRIDGAERRKERVLKRAIMIIPLYKAGKSPTEIAKAIEVTPAKVYEAIKLLKPHMSPLCACGRQATHRGACNARRQRRQEAA